MDPVARRPCPTIVFWRTPYRSSAFGRFENTKNVLGVWLLVWKRMKVVVVSFKTDEHRCTVCCYRKSMNIVVPSFKIDEARCTLVRLLVKSMNIDVIACFLIQKRWKSSHCRAFSFTIDEHHRTDECLYSKWLTIVAPSCFFIQNRWTSLHDRAFTIQHLWKLL